MGFIDEPTQWPAPGEVARSRAHPVQPWWDTLLAYGQLLKPRMVALLVFTAVVGMVVAAASFGMGLSPTTYLVGIIAITAGTSGCNALTGYIDRDIDRLMGRTRERPLCTGRIYDVFPRMPRQMKSDSFAPKLRKFDSTTDNR